MDLKGYISNMEELTDGLLTIVNCQYMRARAQDAFGRGFGSIILPIACSLMKFGMALLYVGQAGETRESGNTGKPGRKINCLRPFLPPGKVYDVNFPDPASCIKLWLASAYKLRTSYGTCAARGKPLCLRYDRWIIDSAKLLWFARVVITSSEPARVCCMTYAFHMAAPKFDRWLKAQQGDNYITQASPLSCMFCRRLKIFHNDHWSVRSSARLTGYVLKLFVLFHSSTH